MDVEVYIAGAASRTSGSMVPQLCNPPSSLGLPGKPQLSGDAGLHCHGASSSLAFAAASQPLPLPYIDQVCLLSDANSRNNTSDTSAETNTSGPPQSCA